MFYVAESFYFIKYNGLTYNKFNSFHKSLRNGKIRYMSFGKLFKKSNFFQDLRKLTYLTFKD
jgi:hypothetical protein